MNPVSNPTSDYYKSMLDNIYVGIKPGAWIKDKSLERKSREIWNLISSDPDIQDFDIAALNGYERILQGRGHNMKKNPDNIIPTAIAEKIQGQLPDTQDIAGVVAKGLPDSLKNPQFSRAGSGYKIAFSASDVASFNRSWPGSSLPDKPITFEYDRNGDLVDIIGKSNHYDGPEILALSHYGNELLARKYGNDDLLRNPGDSNSSGARRGARSTGDSAKTSTDSNTRTKTATRTATSTSTEAYTDGNITVTGGAGDGATTSVNVYPIDADREVHRKSRPTRWRAEVHSEDKELMQNPGNGLMVAAVGTALLVALTVLKRSTSG